MAKTTKKRLVLHVVPYDHKTNSWAVREEEENGTLKRKKKNKEDAVDLAILHARTHANHGGIAQIIIHRQDGTIEDERTYGEDPFPPRG